MRKHIKDVSAGDWVLAEPLVYSRIVGIPWEVSKVSGSRLYVTSYTTNRDGSIEVRDYRHMSIKSVRMVFDSKEDAELVSRFARSESDEYERTISQMMADMRERVESCAGPLPPPTKGQE